MRATKGLSVMISIETHKKVRDNQIMSGETLNHYIEDLLVEYYEMKEGQTMSQTRTLALQIPEALFAEVKLYLKKNKMTQKDFIIGIIKQAIADDETVEETQADEGTDEPTAEESSTNPQADEPTDEPTVDESSTNPQADEPTDEPTADEPNSDDEQVTE